MLKVHTLGRFELALDGTLVEIPLRRAQSLLAFLVTHRGQAYRREKLAGMFWPDQPEESARTNLRHALWRLRKALGRSGVYLIADDISLSFDPQAEAWLDVDEFEGQAEDGGPGPALIEALSLYEGEFLPGFYEDWVVLERERLEAILDRGMQSLLQGLRDEGRWGEVVDWAERWLVLGHRPEPAYRALMIAQANRNDLPGMAEAYRRCREALWEELGVEPSEETRSLYERLAGGYRALDYAEVERAGLPAAAELDPAPGPSPFKGLEFFDTGDADLFYGRELLTARLIGRLREHHFLAIVVGASGSGKSSILRAGLIPALRQAEPLADGSLPPPGSPDWRIRVITPGAHPLSALHEVLSPTAPDPSARSEGPEGSAGSAAEAERPPELASEPRLLLIVDQFEEVFTLCRAEAERRAFIEELMEAVADGSQRAVSVVIALRADYYAHCGQYEKLREALAKHQEYIGPMTAAELRRVIEEPTRRGHWELEPGLVDLILRDVGDEPGGLPLLSHALLETWKRRRGRVLTIAGYAESGGVRGAIAQTAERVFHSLGPEEQRVARRIFLSLTELGEPNDAEGLPAPDSRRQARLEELLPDRGNPNLVRGVLATLVEARLITVGKGMVDVAHEALIREWPSLRGWLTEDRDDLVYRQQLREDAQAWSELDRSVDLLYRGARLSGALEWVAQHSEGGMPLEREFLAASESEHQAQQARELQAAQDQAERERRNARRLRRFAIVLSLATLAAGALAGVAVYFGRLAQQQRAVSTSRELAAAAISQLQEDPELSVLLALEALEESETREAEVALHRAVFASRVEATLGRHQGPVRAALYSPDGDRIVTADEAGTVRIWSSQDWQPVSSWTGHPAPINGLAFSPDGRRLATSGEDEQVRLWNADTAELLQTLAGGGGPVAFSPDGRWLVASQADRSVRLWDLDTGAVARQLEGHQDLVISLTFSADSTRLATAGWDAQLIFWEVNTGRRLQSWEGEFGDLVFHPEDDRLFADFSAGGKILRLPDGEEQVSTGGHTNLVLAGAIDGGWTRIATSGLDRKIVVSDAQSGEQILILGGHAAQVADLAFSPDGRHLVSASGDGSARVWDLAPAREVLTIETLDGYGRIAFSPDGARIAAGDADTIGVWDSVSGAALQRFSQPTLTTGVAFAPDLPWLAGATEGGRLTIWNVDTGDTLWTAEVSEALIFFLAFSPDGRRLAAASEDGHVRVFAADTAALVLDLDLQAPVLSVAFSPVGSQLLTTDFDHNAILWDAESGRRLVTMQHDDLVWGGAFSPDGLRIATASTDGTARIWEAATGSELHRLIGHSSTVVSVAFTPDGSRLATVGRDGTARLWDAETGERLLSLEGEGEGLNGVAVSPDGARLATAGAHAIRFYYLGLGDLQELARDRVTRGLTDEECRVYLHQSGCLP